MCLSPWPGGAFPSAEITSPKALRLRLMFWVSFSLSLSLPAPLEFSRSDPARSTRLSDPSQVSWVKGFEPLMRNVKTECEREERSFMSVAATVRRDCARRSRDRTCEGDSRDTVNDKINDRINQGKQKRYTDDNISNSGVALIMSDFMFLLIQLAASKEVIDGFIILVFKGQYSPLNSIEARLYNLQELAFQFVDPSFAFQVLGDGEHLVYCSRNHAHRFLSLGCEAWVSYKMVSLSKRTHRASLHGEWLSWADESMNMTWIYLSKKAYPVCLNKYKSLVNKYTLGIMTVNSLPVSKDANVVAIDTALRELRNFFKDFCLCRHGLENLM